MRQILSVFGPVAVVLSIAGAAHGTGDVVIEWNDIWLQTVRDTGGGPMPIARAGAIVQGSVFTAVNSIETRYQPLNGLSVPAAAGASKRAAAAQAAHDALVHLYPQFTATYDAHLATSLAGIDPAARAAGVAVGQAAAQAMIAHRAGDHSGDPMTYTPGNNPGDWRPTDGVDAHAPGWGNVTPWTMTSGHQFRPPLPPTLDSQAYADAFNDVKAVGRRTGSTRTADQTEIAWFWANDSDGTVKPPGHLNQITQTLANMRGNTMVQNAHLFALVNMAMADAGIVAWDCKYNTPMDLWRPVTGIQLADTDGNAQTAADPDWQPLSPFSPPFPAYISGHATFGAVHAAIMENYFGTDNVTFTIGTDDPSAAGVMRTFNTFTEAALENGRSRVYLGVHWQFDADAAFDAGQALGDYVYAHALQAIPAPAGSVLALGALGMSALRRRRD